MTQLEKISRYGAYAIVLLNSKILLTQKKSGPYKDLWGLPGGAIEFGETPEEALKRELREETGLAAEKLVLATVAAALGEYTREKSPYLFHHIGIIYRVENPYFIPEAIPEEKMRWLSAKEIKKEELTPFAKDAYSKQLIWRNPDGNPDI